MHIEHAIGTSALCPDRRTRVLVDGFVDFAERYAALVSSAGVPVSAYTVDAALAFASLPTLQMVKTLDRLQSVLRTTETVLHGGGSLRDDHTYLWAMIQRLGLRPQSDLFDRLGSEDVIEIYDVAEQTQVYRNLRYFEACSYTLDDLMCRPWFELFTRDHSVTAHVAEIVEQAIKADPPRLVPFNTGVHTIEEIDSPERLHCVIENRFLAPLFDRRGRATAVVAVARLYSVVSTAKPGPKKPGGV
jgi:hypothetical protein